MKKLFIIPPILVAIGLAGWQIDRQRQAQAKTRTLLQAEMELLEVLEVVYDLGNVARTVECNAVLNCQNLISMKVDLGPLSPKVEEKFLRWIAEASKFSDKVESKTNYIADWFRNLDDRIAIQKRRVAEAEGK